MVWRQGSQLHLQDLGSSNGTYLNGKRIRRGSLRIGDIIQLGQIMLEVAGPEQSRASQQPAGGKRASDTALLTFDPGQSAVLGYPHPGSRSATWREDVAALYSLGATLGVCSDRDETLHLLLDWLRDWAGVSWASAWCLVGGQWHLVLQRGRARRRPPGPIDSSLANRACQREQLVQRRLTGHRGRAGAGKAARSAKHAMAVAVPGSKPPLVIYGERPGSKPPLDPHQVELVQAAAKVLGRALQRLGDSLKGTDEATPSPADTSMPGTFVGGQSMEPVRKAIRQMAAVDATVLITGETGTGKELVARAIHRQSPRALGPFVACNCGALTETLLESELFGHEAGAFTGAARMRKGVFDQADGGTLFLDEIAETSSRLQSKLLRVLEDQRFQRVGGQRSVRVNVRIIAATNRNLAQAVAEGRFRQDLYYRLQVLSIHLPPLRQRKEDIPMLAEYFIGRACLRLGLRTPQLTQGALRKLASHSWPGNVRELRNTIDRAVILSQGRPIRADDIVITEIPASSPAALPTRLDDLERDHILEVLVKTGGNKAQAAAMLGIDRSTLYRKLKRLGVGS